MKVVSPILKRVVYPFLSNSGYLRRRAHGGTFCAVTYHGILPAGYEVSDPLQDGNLLSPEKFRAQLRMLKESYRVVSPEQVHEWMADGRSLPELSVLLTCDDGLRNVLTDMVPILKQEHLSCLFFVLGESAEEHPGMLWYEELYLLLLAAAAGPYRCDAIALDVALGNYAQRRLEWWNLVKRLSQCEHSERAHFMDTAPELFGLPRDWNAGRMKQEPQRRRFGLLNRDELRQLAAEGMSIGAHTLHHPVLSQQSSEIAWQEISESRKQLESVMGASVWALAYPFGDPASMSSREMRMAEQAGFACAFMNAGGGFGAALPKFALPRIHITADMSNSEFETHVSGFHRDLRSRLLGSAS